MTRRQEDETEVVAVKEGVTYLPTGTYLLTYLPTHLPTYRTYTPPTYQYLPAT